MVDEKREKRAFFFTDEVDVEDGPGGEAAVTDERAASGEAAVIEVIDVRAASGEADLGCK